MKIASPVIDADTTVIHGLAGIADSAAPFDPAPLLARLQRPIVFVDLETTGSDPLKDRITEIGLVEIGPDGVSEWTAMLDPQQPIPPFIQQLTGINDEMVRGQPVFDSVAPALLKRLEGKLFVAHNARFDYGFLKNEFRRLDLRFRADVLCTVRLSRALFPIARKHGLDALIERFGLVPKGRHRALADADLLWQFWQKIHQSHTHEHIDATADSLIRRASLPKTVDEDVLDAIPAMPGVYLFYGENDSPLYVGKSDDLKQRVGAHFSAEHSESRDLRLKREIRRVEHHVTAGEIGASLLEAQFIHSLAPTHNRMLRRRIAPCSWHFPDDAPMPRLTSPQERDFGRTEGLFGIFDSRAKAESRLKKIADEHGLCLVTLGLEKATSGSPCAAYRKSRCEGACVGTETSAEHAARVREALAPLRIERWPHKGAIAFAERHRTGLTQWHVVDNWSYLGSSEDPRALHRLAADSTMPLFDREVYPILRRAFKDKRLDVLPLRVERTLHLEALEAPPQIVRTSDPLATGADSTDHEDKNVKTSKLAAQAKTGQTSASLQTSADSPADSRPARASRRQQASVDQLSIDFKTAN